MQFLHSYLCQLFWPPWCMAGKCKHFAALFTKYDTMPRKWWLYWDHRLLWRHCTLVMISPIKCCKQANSSPESFTEKWRYDGLNWSRRRKAYYFLKNNQPHSLNWFYPFQRVWKCPLENFWNPRCPLASFRILLPWVLHTHFTFLHGFTKIYFTA